MLVVQVLYVINHLTEVLVKEHIRQSRILRDVTNNCPIFIFLSLSKLFEKMFHNQLYKYLVSDDLSNNRNSCFNKQYSTIFNLLVVTHKLYEAKDEKLQTTIVFLDISKLVMTFHTLLFHPNYISVILLAPFWGCNRKTPPPRPEHYATTFSSSFAKVSNLLPWLTITSTSVTNLQLSTWFTL